MFRASFRSITALRPAALTVRQNALPAMPVRFYAANISKTDIEARVLNIVKAFDKVKDPSKISASSSFKEDLGLDSLDTVEVVMAIEEEFSVEIPDEEADKIVSVGQAVEYVSKHPEGSSLFPTA